MQIYGGEETDRTKKKTRRSEFDTEGKHDNNNKELPNTLRCTVGVSKTRLRWMKRCKKLQQWQQQVVNVFYRR